MRRQSVFLLIASVFLCGAALTVAEAAPLSLEGSWSGTGTVTYKSGSDQVRCRVRYTKAGGNSFDYTSVCSTENGHYDLSGRVSSAGSNRYTGTVEGQGQVGRVSMQQRGNNLSVIVTSGQGSARINLSRR